MKEVVGSTVHTPYNNKNYRVDDVAFTVNPTITFEQKGKQVSFVDYYKIRYGVTINDHRQPMLVSRPSVRDVRGGKDLPILLVPELCFNTGLTDKMRANFHMIQAMAQHTQLNPDRRKARIERLTARLYDTPESALQLSRFNMDIDKSIFTFQGRALKQEMMVFGKGQTAENNDRVDWTNALRSKQMLNCIELQRWVCLFPKNSKDQFTEFLQALKQAASGMNYVVKEPKSIELPNDRLSTYVEKLQEVIKMNPKMILVVVPNNAADRYAAIKKLTCVDNTILTQVIVHKTMVPKKGGLLSVATKVMIQMNCKLGGAPWMIKFPLKGVMTIGFDVNHDTRNKSLSYGAFIASMDLQQKVEFFSAASSHKDGQEIATNINSHMARALKQYKDTHGALPERVVFYRDGVGDGQIEYVFNQELRGIREKMSILYERFGDGKEPKLTFIIVNKRLNTRIFQRGRQLTNPAPGTVVDNTITLPERYDFYLVSQSVRQGTVAPTSYNVLYDTSGLTPDKIQMLSYKMTHLYFNWSGTTRVPAVVQYAHKLALLAGQSLHQPPNQAWDNKLYFL
jgi:aubergine-like protein